MRSYGDDIKKRLRQREDMFLRRLMGMLAKMAKADGKVDAWETHAEGAFAWFPRAAARRKFCVCVFNESKKSRISLYRQAWEFSNEWGASSSDCLAVYELLWDIACSTGFLKPVHKSIPLAFCHHAVLGFLHARCLSAPDHLYGLARTLLSTFVFQI